jgi:alpha-tubulin suppressor-like RCC1 family protein
MLDSLGQLWVSGSNKMGCLGLSDTKPRNMPVVLNFFINNRIIDMACGEHFTVVIAESFQFN